MLSARTNLQAKNADRQFQIAGRESGKIEEKLSSGYRINRAADDAAGLAISEKMRRQIRGLHQAAENIQDGIGYVKTAEGALGEVHDMLQRMNELAVQAANGTCSDADREMIDGEVQALKTEMERVFRTTSFNERLIWEPTEVVQVGVEQVQAVTFLGASSTSADITNANCGVLPYGSYVIHADADGVSVSWNAYDGNTYQTEKIDWDTLKNDGYRFDLADHFGMPGADNPLYDSSGAPVFHCAVAFQVQEQAELDDIIQSIDGVTMSSSESVSMSGRFEDAAGAPVSNGVSVSASLNYGAAYASQRNAADGHDFDQADDTFLEPSGTGGNLVASPSASTVGDARNSTEGWTFSFEMEGIGHVTASSYSSSYYAPSDRADDDEHYWWKWYTWWDSNGARHQSKESIERSGDGTLGAVMAALTGEKGSATPGLLTQANGGDCDGGGYIQLYFTLTADNRFSYGSTSSNSVGSFTLTIRVNSSDTEESVLQKIRDALHPGTILDFYTTSSGSDREYTYRATAKHHTVDVPVYGGTCTIEIQSGPESDHQIPIVYDSLRLQLLGLTDTNTKTAQAARGAIDEVKDAMHIISGQRSDFGAYQNCLEHAYRANKNAEENTQAAESLIRDTDMARTMVAASLYRILLQAGTAMLAQANQQPAEILRLLRGE